MLVANCFFLFSPFSFVICLFFVLYFFWAQFCIVQSLLLLNYLVRNGSERVVTSSREHIYDLRSLENYTFTDENGKDQGINVRHKVRELIDFIQDDDKLRDERKKAKKNKDKYIGMSSEAMGGMRMSSSSSGGGGYNDWDSSKRDKFSMLIV